MTKKADPKKYEHTPTEVEPEEVSPEQVEETPAPKQEAPKKGLYLRTSDVELYPVKYVEDDPLGRTHKCSNERHYWEGTDAQFRAAFTNSDGSPIGAIEFTQPE